MANWCSNYITFFAENDNGLEELRTLNYKLSEVFKDKEPYLYKVLEAHGLDCESYSCRGSITDYHEIEVGNNSFEIFTETAWAPTDEMWQVVIEKYPNINYVYTAEEPGFDIYINTDESGVYYTDRYKVDTFYESPSPQSIISKIGYGSSFCESLNNTSEYFTCLEDALMFFSNKIGREFINQKHLEDFFYALETANDSSYYLGLHEYSNN